MWVQKVYLKKDYTVVSAASDVFDVPRTDPITGILLRWHMSSGVGEAAALADEVVAELIKNGSDVITSVQYGQLASVDMLLKPALYKIADLGASAVAYYVLWIPFGRYIGDQEYFLDPRTFASLELKIKQGTITATTVKNMDAILYVMRECPLASKGYFKVSTKKAYTAAAAVEYIELDRANKYAAILVGEMDGTSTGILSVLSNLKLNIDGGKMIPFDEAAQDIFDEVSLETNIKHDSDPSAPTINTNFLALNYVNPWKGEDNLLDAPKFGKLTLEATGLAAGSIRVTAIELVK